MSDEQSSGPPKQLTIEIPVRMLNVVGCAAKENGRYQIDGVLVETVEKDAKVSAVATDGHRMLLAEWGLGMFDDAVRLIVPGAVAKSAVKLATHPREGQEEPTAVIRQTGKECTLTVATINGDAILGWQESEAAFPDYRTIIPDWSDSPGIGLIGISPDLVASTLKTMQKVVGTEPKTRVMLPASADRPLGFESTDGVTIRVLAVVMPCKIEGWTDKPLATPAAWREIPVTEIVGAGLATLLLQFEVDTFGKLEDWRATGKPKIKGLGDSRRQEIDDAIEKWWAAHPEEKIGAEIEKEQSALVESARAESLKDIDEAHAELPPAEPKPHKTQSAREVLATGKLFSIGPDSGITITRNEAGHWSSYAVRIGKHSNDTGDNATGPHATEADALGAAAAEVKGWLEGLGRKGLRGSGPGEVQAMVRAIDALLVPAAV